MTNRTTRPGQAILKIRLNGMAALTWTNVGSFLVSEPRLFLTESEARDFCRDRHLKIIETIEEMVA